MAEFILTFGTEISLGGADLPWDPLERYQALMAVDALEEASSPHLCNAPGSPGAKTSMLFGSPTKVDTVALDERHPIPSQHHVLRSLQKRDQPRVVSWNAMERLERSEDASNPTELPYDPLVRYSIMAKNFHEPRGAKSVEHEAILRTSNPCYGSLTPSKERPNVAELPYEPTRRYLAMVKSLKVPRGHKSVDHLEHLRTSNPCYNSLLPARERPGQHELPYDPAKRYVALAKTLRTPRGSKPFEHLRNLRISDPSLDRSLSPQHTSSGDEDPEAEEVSPGASRAVAIEEAAVSEMSLRGRALSGSSLGRLPRILSNQAFEPLDDDDDDDDSLLLSPSPRDAMPRYARGAQTWAPPPPMRNSEYYREPMPPLPSSRFRRDSRDSSDTQDDSWSARDSLRSNARTEMRVSERSSNDTIASFLDDHEPSVSGEWSRAELAEFSSSPKQSKAPAGKQPRKVAKKDAAGADWAARKAAIKPARHAVSAAPEGSKAA